MIKILPDNSEIYQSKGVSMVFRSMIHAQLSENLRREAALCLTQQETKDWKIYEPYCINIDYQLDLNKNSKILKIFDNTSCIRVHCLCKYSWKSTLRWQYKYNEKSEIWLLDRYEKAKCDYIAIFNRHMNQMLLIPRSEFETAKSELQPILNKMNGYTTNELVYKINLFQNNNIEYFYKTYDNSTSTWIKSSLG